MVPDVLVRGHPSVKHLEWFHCDIDEISTWPAQYDVVAIATNWLSV